MKSKNVDKNSNGLKKWTKTQIFESKPNKRNVEGKDKKILLREKNITGHPNTPASNFFRMNAFVIVLISQIYALNVIEAVANLPTATETIVKKTKCSSGQVYDMIGTDCSQMDLREVPQHLKAKYVEMFDLSINRIRELNKDSFTRYPKIRLLYLFDNSIQYIEEGTFVHLTSLEVIDLSINALRDISLELFELPYLRNMYYSNNSLLDIDNQLKSLKKPVVAPLMKLSFANCRLQSVPNLGILPDLVLLNISFNLMQYITPQQFSPYCNLQMVALENDNKTEMNQCMCQTLQIFFDRRKIKLVDWFDCPRIHEEQVYCTESTNATVDTIEFDQCMERLEEKHTAEKTKRVWFWIVFSLGIFFITFICTLYYCHRRNAALNEKKSTKLRHIHQTSNGNVEVLLSQ